MKWIDFVKDVKNRTGKSFSESLKIAAKEWKNKKNSVNPSLANRKSKRNTRRNRRTRKNR
jgi:hypothetical protein